MPDPDGTMDGGPADTLLALDNTDIADRIPLHPTEVTEFVASSDVSNKRMAVEHVPEYLTDIANGVRTDAEPLDDVVHSAPVLTELYSFQSSQVNDTSRTEEETNVVYGDPTDTHTDEDAVEVNLLPPVEDKCTPVEPSTVDTAPTCPRPVEPPALEPTDGIADDTMKPDFEYNSLETDEELSERQAEDNVNDADVDMLPASPLHVILNAEDEDATEHDAIEDDDFELNALDDDIVQREVEVDEDWDEAEDIELSFDDDASEEHDDEGDEDEAEDIDRSLDEECEDVYSPSAVSVDDANEADCIIPDRPQATRTAKKRRRILAVTSINGDSSSADDCDVADVDDGDVRLGVAASIAAGGDDDVGGDSRLVNERLQQLVQNEKPGPRSKKASTQLLMELQARALLQSAVVVPVVVPADGKKRKMRILESDDDDDGDAAIGAAAVTDSLYDIGAETEPIDLDADPEQLIIGEPGPTLVGHDDDQANAVSVAQMLFPEEADSNRQEEDEEDEIELKIFIDVIDEALHDLPQPSELEANVDAVKVKAEINTNTPEKPAVKTEANNIAIEPSTTDASPTKVNGDSSRTQSSPTAAKSPPTRVKDEPEPASARKASGRPAPQRKSLYSESEDEYVPNDVYFGTPDRSDLLRKPRGRGRGSGQSAMSRYEAERCKYEQKKVASTRGRGRGRGRPTGPKSKSYRQQYESDSCSTEASSSSDSDVRHRKARKPKPKGYTHHQPSSRQSAGSSSKSMSKSAKRKPVSGRFRDKSRTIPNDVYFDAKVPLHVLYSYGTESSEDELPPFPPLSTITGRPLNKSNAYKLRGGRGGRGRGRGSSSISTCNKSTSTATVSAFNSSKTSSKRGRKPSLGTSSADLRLKHMIRCFRAAGFQKQRLRDLWKDSDTTVERADKVLRLLCDVGLDGDPNIDNCRLLRKTVICNEEARELDPSLIIQAEGRTRRSVTAALTAGSPTATTEAAAPASSDSETAPTTLSSIKRLIDSDSDDE